MSDKFTIPHDLTAERAFVAAVLVSEGAALDTLPGTTPDLCHDYRARSILSFLVEGRARGLPLDPVALRQRMDADPALHKPVDGGWSPDICRLHGEGIASTASHYFGILREQLTLRRLHALYLWGAAHCDHRAVAADLLAQTSQRLAQADAASDTADHALPAVCDDALRDLDALDAGNPARIIRTPLNVWNDAFGGLPAGSYIALGGRPGAGKSAMMEQIIWDLINQEQRVLLFEKDMPLKMWLFRLACRAENVPFWKWSKSYTSREERDKLRFTIKTLRDGNYVRLHNPPRLTGESMAAIVRREQRLFGVQAVFLDHIQILHTRPGHMREDLTQHSIAIRESASTTDIPHVVLFQLNREGGNGSQPSAANVKEFDQLYADVDGMAILWKDAVAEGQAPPDPKAQTVHFLAAKNRAGGESQEDVTFHGPNMTFINR